MTNLEKTAVVAGRSQEAAGRRRALFVEAYLTNGGNATRAAISAGLSPSTAKSTGQRMLKRPDIASLIAERAGKVMSAAQLNTQRWAAEMACIGHFDPAELYDADGNLIPLHQLPEHVRRAISGVSAAGRAEYKFWDKVAALNAIGKHLGVFERDNQQKVADIRVMIQLVG